MCARRKRRSQRRDRSVSARIITVTSAPMVSGFGPSVMPHYHGGKARPGVCLTLRFRPARTDQRFTMFARFITSIPSQLRTDRRTTTTAQSPRRSLWGFVSTADPQPDTRSRHADSNAPELGGPRDVIRHRLRAALMRRASTAMRVDRPLGRCCRRREQECCIAWIRSYKSRPPTKGLLSRSWPHRRRVSTL